MVWKVRVDSLGCKVNQAESLAMETMLDQAPFRKADPGENPDLVVVNTCAVTNRAAAKSRRLIRRLSRRFPHSVVAVMGCYSQTEREAVEQLPGVDLVVGTHGRKSLRARALEALQGLERGLEPGESFASAPEFERLPVQEHQSRVRALLKVQDGCRQFCSYCIVPRARGPLRSLPLSESWQQGKALVAQGHPELVLTGVNLGAYGRDLPSGADLGRLLEGMQSIRGLKRLRLSSLEPQEISLRLLRIMASLPSFCPHLHLPLQSGSDRILREMKRPYTAAAYQRLVEEARKLMPDLALTTDVMVGFPGETERDFLATVDLLESLGPAGVHVFSFSPRPGTAADEKPYRVPEAEKAKRHRYLQGRAREWQRAFVQGQYGKILEILEEHWEEDAGGTTGYSRNYLRAVLPDWKPQPGRCTRALLSSEEDNSSLLLPRARPQIMVDL